MDKQTTLYIGNKHFSSWSMRPWLLMKNFEIPFREQIIPLYKNTSKEEVAKVSPSGKVPVLVDHDVRIWDSLAICEYLAEKFPRLPMWPDSTKYRAQARSLCCEMHSSFVSMRKECSMDLLVVHHDSPTFSKETLEDVARIDTILHECREAHRSKGKYLFGEFGIVDAYFLPVISRIRTYALRLGKSGSAEYYNHMIGTPLFKMWVEEAKREVV
jgi:glutathione S-transferase